eukprot:c16125_g1_i1 orf=203-2128(-)
MHLDLDAKGALSNHHFTCTKTVDNEFTSNLDTDRNVSTDNVQGLVSDCCRGVNQRADELDGSTNKESTDEDVAGAISNDYKVMETMHSADFDDNMGKDLRKQQASYSDHNLEDEKECENLSNGSDFYEEVKITDDAGEPLMPRSLLDLAVEDIVQKANDEGHLLWQKFRKAAARRHVFTCKSVVDSWLEEGNIASRPALIYTILAFRSWKKNKRALELFDWVVAEKAFEMTDMDHAIYIDLVGKIDGCKMASKHYTQIPKSFQTTMVYSVLLAAYVEHNMEKCARRLLSRARLMGLAEQVFLYNQLLFFYKGKGRISDVADLLKEMEELGVDANLYTYNIILDLRARKGDVVGMRNVWKCLEKEKNMKPDAASYALLARGYINAGLRGKAECAIKRIEVSPYRQKQVVFRWLLKLYAQLKREEDLERVWGLLSSISKSPVDDYSIMIESLGKAGELKRAEEMFKEGVNKFGIKRLHQYHALLSVFLNNGMIQKAEDLVEKMSKDSFNPGSATYHQLIEMYVRNGDEKKAMETLGKAQNASKIFSGHKPWYASYLTIIEMFGEKGDVEHAELIIKDLKGAGYPCGFKMYSALLRAYVKANMTPYGFLDRMRADGAIPNSHIRNELSKVSEAPTSARKTRFAL